MRRILTTVAIRDAAVGLAACVAFTAVPTAGLAQQPLLHLPLDGSLENRGSLGGTAQMFSAEDAAPPQFVSGYRGQALSFKGESVVALPFNLDHDVYPRVTITAWVREEPGASGTRAVLATGSSAGARMHVGGRLAARAGRSGVSFDERMPAGDWVFIASVMDTTAAWARLHQNEGVYRRDGLAPGSKPPDKVSAPDDPDSEPVAWLTVGAATLRNWQQSARAVMIDDVRLYPEALTEEQVEAIRTTGALAPVERAPPDPPPKAVPEEQAEGIRSAGVPPPTGPVPPDQLNTAQSAGTSATCDSSADCATGSYCARDRTCHPDSHRPLAASGGTGTTLEQMQGRYADRTAGMVDDVNAKSSEDILPDAPAGEPGDTMNSNAVSDGIDVGPVGTRPLDLEYESEEAAIEAQERREAAAAQAEAEAEAQSSGEQIDYRIGFDTAILQFSGVSGDSGDYSERILFDDREFLLQGMTTRETNDKPCRVVVLSGRVTATQFIAADGTRTTDRTDNTVSSLAGKDKHEVDVCDEGLPAIRFASGDTSLSASDFKGPITGIQVCTRGDNKRVKGLRARVRDISDPPDSHYAGSYENHVLLERTNCSYWHPLVQCPANTYAIGVQLHFRDGSLKFVSERDYLSGVERVCSGVEWGEM